MSTKSTIKRTLALITKAITSVPQEKRKILHTRVTNTLKKHQKSKSQHELQAFKNDLQFNLNFIRLAYPDIDFKKIEQLLEEQKNPKPETNKKEQESEQFFSLDTSHGAKQVLPSGEVREQVQFSNWFQGNHDPENLERHRKLLERQHFMGDYWKENQMPVSFSRGYLQNIISKGPPEKMPEKNQEFKKPEVKFDGDPDQRFEKVKR